VVEMAKRRNKKSNSWIWIVLTIAFLGLVYYGGAHDWFNFNFNFSQQTALNTPPDPNAPITCTISKNRDNICIGDSVTVRLNAQANTLCQFFYQYNNRGWKELASRVTSSSGLFEETTTMNNAGSYMLRAICGNCLTNIETLNVINCSTPPDNQPSYTCGLSGECQTGTCPTNYQCNEVWFELYTKACVCTTGGDEGTIHPDWKPGAVNYHPTTEDTCNEECINYGKPEYYTGNKGGYKGQCLNQFMVESYQWQLDCCCYRDSTPYNPALLTCDWYCTQNQAWQGGPFQHGLPLGYTECSTQSTQICGHQSGMMSVGGTFPGFPPICCCFNC